MPYIPHNEQDIKEMLDKIGVASIDDLFSEIPTRLFFKEKFAKIPQAFSEMEVAKLIEARMAKNKGKLSFIGAGAYEHYIPAPVWDLTRCGEFVTSYTPYQAEASQGTLQIMYEYQTMMANLMHMEVSNASLYDGASALAEAVLMAIRIKNSRVKTVLIPRALSKVYRDVVRTIVSWEKIKLIEIPFAPKSGILEREILNNYQNEDIAALIIPHPNFFGLLEDVDFLTDWAHQKGALVIALVNPLSTVLLKAPGQWGTKGADIACGNGQPLGIPLSFGGPHFGFMTTKKKYIRQIPGRLVARTLDREGKEGFVLTLQAREQHIRRAKATSNICTNQGLLVIAATIYMSLLGASGMCKVALSSYKNAKILAEKLSAIDGVDLVFFTPFFHEFVIRFRRKVSSILEKLSFFGIDGGYDLTCDYPELGNALLICATETKSFTELDFYKEKMQEVMHG